MHDEERDALLDMVGSQVDMPSLAVCCNDQKYLADL